jgi:predicted nucleic acid-binding protein
MAAVVADTSPLIALQQLGRLSLLQRIFEEISVPPAVARELSPGMPELPSWIVVRALTQPIASAILRASLGAGESEALSLVLEVKAELFIVDDRPARRLALNLGIPNAGTTGLLLRAKQLGFVPEVRPLLDEIIRRGFRLSPAIRERVLADAGETAEDQRS